MTNKNEAQTDPFKELRVRKIVLPPPPKKKKRKKKTKPTKNVAESQGIILFMDIPEAEEININDSKQDELEQYLEKTDPTSEEIDISPVQVCLDMEPVNADFISKTDERPEELHVEDEFSIDPQSTSSEETVVEPEDSINDEKPDNPGKLLSIVESSYEDDVTDPMDEPTKRTRDQQTEKIDSPVDQTLISNTLESPLIGVNSHNKTLVSRPQEAPKESTPSTPPEMVPDVPLEKIIVPEVETSTGQTNNLNTLDSYIANMKNMPQQTARIVEDFTIKPPPEQIHKQELRRFGFFLVVFFGFGLIPYTTPALADYRPWIQGEPVPLLNAFSTQTTITEGKDGSLQLIPAANKDNQLDSQIVHEGQSLVIDEQAEEEIKESIEQKIAQLPPVPNRSPAKAEPLQIPTKAMDNYFYALAKIESQKTDQIARALVWGDSTIASDGIIKNIRARMQNRFGDGGPGFVPVQVDPRWSMRKDVYRKFSNNWKTHTIVHGGAATKKYGLSGMVSSTSYASWSKLGGRLIEDKRQPISRFQLFYQQQSHGGDFTVSWKNGSKKISTKGTTTQETNNDLFFEQGIDQLKINTQGNGKVTFYGVAMETDGPGVTWETFGVSGSSVQSMRKQSKTHLINQVEQRDPKLIVYWTGGNELGYPSLKSKTGKAYKKLYRDAITKLTVGAPNASCLLIGPLDQATKNRGYIVSKPTIHKMIRFQKEIAAEMGCAYWDAQAAMGGNGSFLKWKNHKPRLASPDLAHLTRRGRDIIGETLADSIIRAYDIWKLKNPEVQRELPDVPSPLAKRPSNFYQIEEQNFVELP